MTDTRVLIPLESDLTWGLEGGQVVIFDGRSHVVQAMEDVIIPDGRSEHVYWFAEYNYDDI